MTASRFSTRTRPSTALRLLMATLVVAAAGGLSQTAWAAPQGGPHEGFGGHGGMGQPQHVQRMLGAVNATPEQRAQVKQIMDAARADSAGQRDAARSLRQQSLAVFTQPNVDARAAEALRQQLMALHEQASKRHLQVMLDVSRVLTPEQRKTLAETLGKRREMMERHHAERQSAQPAPR